MARGDWVPCQTWGTQSGIVAALEPTNILLVRHGELFSPPDVAVMEETDDLIVERVVGQLDLFATGEDEVLVIARIRLGLYDDVANTAAFYSDDFASGPEANEPFLWQRVYILPNNALRALDITVHPAWSMIDVKVSRRIQRDQALFLSVASVNADAIMTPFLRSWVRTKS